MDILAGITDKKGNDLTADEIKEILGTYFTSNTIPEDLTDLTHEMTTKSGAYKVKLSEVLNGANIASPTQSVATLGEKYDEFENNNNSMIGKMIDFKSANNATDWIILGKQVNAQGKNDVIITTKNPVSTQKIQYTLAEWTGYEGKLNNACKTYVGQTGGTLGTKAADIKEVRSITLDDINNAVGFSETINNVTISNSNGGFAYPNSDGTGWVKNTDAGYSSWPPEGTEINEAYYYYNDNGTYKINSMTNGFSNATTDLGKSDNMKYILANNTAYWVASRSVYVSSNQAYFVVASVVNGYVGSNNGYYLCDSNASAVYDRGGSYSMSLRPCVVLSSEITWSDVESLIGSSATY